MSTNAQPAHQPEPTPQQKKCFEDRQVVNELVTRLGGCGYLLDGMPMHECMSKLRASLELMDKYVGGLKAVADGFKLPDDLAGDPWQIAAFVSQWCKEATEALAQDVGSGNRDRLLNWRKPCQGKSPTRSGSH